MLFFKNNKNSLPQQVSENMKRIEVLEAYVKHSYYTRNDYGDDILPTPWAVDLASTDIPQDTPIGAFDGFLLSKDSKLFSIINIQYEYDQQAVPYKIVNANYVCNIKGDKGDTGSAGPAGPAGQDGRDGQDGTSFQITGYVDTPQDLPATASVGDAYAVGVSEPKDIYVWVSSPSPQWVNLGNMEGPQGPAGPTGPAGQNGQDGRDGTDGTDGVTPNISMTATVSDTTGTPTVTVTKTGTTTNPLFSLAFENLKGEPGEEGPEGPEGPPGPPGPAGSGGSTEYYPTSAKVTTTVNNEEVPYIIPPEEIKLPEPSYIWNFGDTTYYDDPVNNLHYVLTEYGWQKHTWYKRLTASSGTAVTIDAHYVIWCNHNLDYYYSSGSSPKAFYINTSTQEYYILINIEGEDLRWIPFTFTLGGSATDINYAVAPKLIALVNDGNLLLIANTTSGIAGCNMYYIDGNFDPDNVNFDFTLINFYTNPIQNFDTMNLWQPYDNDFLYYSNGSEQYGLTRYNSSDYDFDVANVNPTGLSSYYSFNNIWFDNGITYYSDGSSNYYLYSASTLEWYSISWQTVEYFNGGSVFYLNKKGMLFANNKTYVKQENFYNWVEEKNYITFVTSNANFWSDGLHNHYDYANDNIHKIEIDGKWVDVEHEFTINSPYQHIWYVGDFIFYDVTGIYNRKLNKFVYTQIDTTGMEISITNYDDVWQFGEQTYFIDTNNSEYYLIEATEIDDGFGNLSYSITATSSIDFDLSIIPTNNSIYRLNDDVYCTYNNQTYKLVNDENQGMFVWTLMSSQRVITTSGQRGLVKTNDGILLFTTQSPYYVYRLEGTAWKVYDSCYFSSNQPVININNKIYYLSNTKHRYYTKADRKYIR